jgi:hypothetical protein
MFIMNKQEIEQASHVWPANAKQPLERDMQILLMSTARKRREIHINNIMKQLENERKEEHDPIG